MKTLAILFTLFYFLNALAVAPYGFKGQQQAATLYSNVLQFPNNQVTNMGGINALAETGNSNILSNPSFEHLTANTGWVDNGTATGIGTAVAVISGKKAYGFLPTAQTINLTQSSTLYQAQFADGVQGLAMVRIKSDVALKVCSIQAGTVSTTNCVTTATDSKWGLYKIPFILGATSNGISIASNGTLVTGTVYVDDAFVGAVDLKQDINNIGPWTSYTPTFTGFGTVASSECFHRQNGTNRDVRCKFTAGTTTAVEARVSLPLSDIADPSKLPTTVSIIGKMAQNSSATGFFNESVLIEPSVSYLTFGRQSSTTDEATKANGNNILSTGGIGSFFASYPATQLSGSSSVYTASNADTDWASCGHTAASFTGFGTVSAIETQCKRQGSDLLMKGKFTSGTVTAVESRVSLPLWNGTQLVSAGTSKIPSFQILGSSVRSNVGAANNIFAAIQPSSSYFVFTSLASPAGTTSILGSSFGSSETQTMGVLRIPINGWEQSNIIIGQFNGLQTCTDTLACTDTFSAFIGAAGVVSTENVNWINGNASVSDTSLYGISFNTGIFTTAPNCVLTPISTNAAATLTTLVSSISSTAINARTMVNAAKTAFDFSIVCQKQGADYIGKTAMAVASDQNVRSIGSTNVDIQSVGFADGTTCSSGTCVINNKVGNKITSVTWTATGIYHINGIDGTKYNCIGAATQPVGAAPYTPFIHDRITSSSSFAKIYHSNAATLLTDATYATVTCIGIP